MVKIFVPAIVLTISLGSYAAAQDTAPGSPAGITPMTPAPMMHMLVALAESGQAARLPPSCRPMCAKRPGRRVAIEATAGSDSPSMV